MQVISALTQEQMEAVKAPPNGVNLVLAIPGSGKTTVFCHRIAFLVNEVGVNPGSIMALTFAKKAALEISTRLKELLPNSSSVTVGTFHSICYRILKNEMNFQVVDDDEKIRIIKKIVSSKALKPEKDVGEIIRTISLAKNNMIDCNKFKEECQSPDEVKLAAVYELYQAALKDLGKIDMEDMLLMALQLLMEKPTLLEDYQRRFHYVLCDESQDNNKVQAELLYIISKPNDNILLCGDDDQSLFGWRASNAEYILNIKDIYPDARTYLLGSNFRSTGAIIKAADNLIRHNSIRYPKELKTTNEYGSEVEVLRATDEADEARIVADLITSLVKQGEVSFDDIAILYRMNSMSLPFEDLFPARGIPYELVGGNNFFSRREISSIINYLKIIKDPSDDEALLSILDLPVRYLGGRIKDEIRQFGAEHAISCHEAMNTMRFPRMYQAKNVRELLLNLDYIRSMPGQLNVGDLIAEIRAIFGLNGYFKSDEIAVEDNSRIQNIEELQKKASEFDCLDKFLQYVQIRQVKQTDNRGVKLWSAHSSKGTELSVVIIIGCNEGIIPHQKCIGTSIEEERRLFYVAMTRAKHRLYLSYRLHQDNKTIAPSRFLKEALPESSF